MSNHSLAHLANEAKEAVAPDWLKKLPYSWRQDMLAGLSVAVVAIPQSLAYAQLAGLPAYLGLYAGFLPTIVAGISSSSPHISTGATAIISLLTFASVSEVSTPKTDEYILLVGVLALMVGVFQLIFGVLKLGSLIRYVAHPVVTGFVSAAAIIIMLSQLEMLFGIEGSGHENSILSTLGLFGRVGQIDLPTLIYGIFSITIIIVARRVVPYIPGVLLAVLATTIVSWQTGYTGDIVGLVPTNIPSLGLVVGSLGNIRLLLLPAFLISVIGYMEGYSVVKSMNGSARNRIRPNVEMVSQGLSNIAAGASGTMPVAGSFSRTALNFAVGAKTGFASVVVGLVALFAILFFAPLFRYLPLATLAAIILTAVYRLVNFSHITELIRHFPRDGLVALVTFSATLLLAPQIDYGILIGIIASILMILYRSARPPYKTLFLHWQLDPNLSNFSFKHYKSNDHVMILAWDSSITFINSGTLEDELLRAPGYEPPIRYVLVLGRGVNSMDSSGAESIHFGASHLRKKRIRLMFSGLKPSIRKEMKESGLYTYIGKRNFFSHANDALREIHRRENAIRNGHKNTAL